MKVRVSDLALAQFDVILTEMGAVNSAAKAGLIARFRARLRRIGDFPEVARRPQIRRSP